MHITITLTPNLIVDRGTNVVLYCLNYLNYLFCLQDTRVVGPFLPSPAKPLPSELEQFVQSAGDEGVILVSFGSVVGEYTGISESLLQVMAEAFSTLPQKVVWKLKLAGKFICSSSNLFGLKFN